MFADNSNGCFGKCPQDETEPTALCLLLPAEIVERLLHGITKLLTESLRVQGKKFSVVGTNSSVFIHSETLEKVLVADRDADKTGPLVYDQADKS